ncbi:MAG: alpha/beta hydrolase fold domain-containing protein [Bryobacterales bacterium]
MPRRFLACLCLSALTIFPLAAQDDPGAPVPPPDYKPKEVIELWPGKPPGETGDVGPEIMLVERRRPFYQITNVTTPTVSVFPPDPAKATGAGVMVFPGGGLVRLAIEHEGYEIAEWLNSQGVAAFLVKYRVPPRGDNPRERWKAGVQDAQRAIRIVRSRAKEFGVDPEGLGAIGFSAGAEIGTWLSLLGEEEGQYPPIDAVDDHPTRPAFMMNIYPGGLAFGFRGQEPAVRQDILERINAQTPPMFFAHAFPDASFNSILMLAEMRKRNAPAELHVFQDGAHGFGVRKGGLPLTAWPRLATAWMRSLGFLDARYVRSYASELSEALRGKAAKLPLLTEVENKASMADAYASQKRVIARVYADERIVGYKGAASSAAAQKAMKINGPLYCALFAPAVHKAAETKGLALDPNGVVETELAYVMGVDIPTRIEDAGEAQTATQHVIPAIELPWDLAKRTSRAPSAVDMVAANCGGETRIVLGAEHHPDKVDLAKLPIRLARDGREVSETTSAATKGGQWQNLMTLINQVIDNGGVIHEGDIILSGAIGPVGAAQEGTYVADYGALGKVEFELR